MGLLHETIVLIMFSRSQGYINRIRGYHASDSKYPGFENGIIPSWYYATEDRFDNMQTYYPVKKQFYAREFPTSWRLLETGIDAFHTKLKAGGSTKN